MPNIEIPDQDTMYKVAYLTVKGWRCFRETWYKDGQRLKIGGCYSTPEKEIEQFSLEEAFNRQEDIDNGYYPYHEVKKSKKK